MVGVIVRVGVLLAVLVGVTVGVTDGVLVIDGVGVAETGVYVVNASIR